MGSARDACGICGEARQPPTWVLLAPHWGLKRASPSWSSACSFRRPYSGLLLSPWQAFTACPRAAFNDHSDVWGGHPMAGAGSLPQTERAAGTRPALTAALAEPMVGGIPAPICMSSTTVMQPMALTLPSRGCIAGARQPVLVALPRPSVHSAHRRLAGQTLRQSRAATSRVITAMAARKPHHMATCHQCRRPSLQGP